MLHAFQLRPNHLAAILCDQVNEYIRSLEKKPGRNLESLYPAADPAAIQLLKKMLMFNPAKRCTVEEALDHDFLKPVRRKDMEVSDNTLSDSLSLSSTFSHYLCVIICRIEMCKPAPREPRVS